MTGIGFRSEATVVTPSRSASTGDGAAAGKGVCKDRRSFSTDGCAGARDQLPRSTEKDRIGRGPTIREKRYEPQKAIAECFVRFLSN